MKKILVPIDFSPESCWGFYYAYDFASIINAELVILNIYTLDVNRIFSAADIDKMKEEEKIKRLGKLKEMTNQYLANKLNLTKIHYVVDYGKKSQLADFAKYYAVDLIIMGKLKGDTFLDNFLGNVTSKVVQKSLCPVLFVPEMASQLKECKSCYYQ